MNENIKKLIEQLVDKGIRVPVIQDPVTKLPSVSLTLVVISAGFVMFGLFNKVAQIVHGVDMDSALSFFYSSSALYFGRSFAGGKTPTLEKTNERKET